MTTSRGWPRISTALSLMYTTRGGSGSIDTSETPMPAALAAAMSAPLSASTRALSQIIGSATRSAIAGSTMLLRIEGGDAGDTLRARHGAKPQGRRAFLGERFGERCRAGGRA